MKKVLSILLSALTYLFLAVCVLGLVVSISAKKDADGAANLFGKQLRLVQSNSMEKCDQTDVSGYEIQDIPVKSLVIIDLIPEEEAQAKVWYDDLKVGDVLTFRYVYVRQETITHRITKITPKGEGYILHLEGDNKNADGDTLTQIIDTTQTNSPNYVLGKVTGVSYGVGLFLYTIKSPVGLVCVIILPCLMIMAFEIFRIISLLTERKRSKEKAKARAQEKEVEELKRQVERLQKELRGGENHAEKN